MKRELKQMACGAGAILFLLVTTVQQGEAQQILLPDTAHAIVTEGLDYVYDLRYDEADKLFQRLIDQYPKHPAGEFLMALNDWWRIKPNIADAGAVARYTTSFNAHLDRTIEMSDELLAENDFDMVGLFFRGAAYGYRARLKATYNPNTNSLADWYSIFRDANEGRKALLGAQRLAPGNSDILLGSGIFNYYVDAMPERYPILNAVSLPPGDKNIGLKMLQIAADRALYSAVEADYALIEILTNFEKDYKGALAIASKLHGKYPNNPDFHKYYARNLYYTRSYDKAYREWGSLMRKVKAKKPGFALSMVRQGLYYMGDIKLRKGNPSKAVEIFTQAVKVNERLDEEDSGYYVASMLRLANAYDKLGKRSEALKWYNEVLDNGDASERYQKRAKDGKAKPYTGS